MEDGDIGELGCLYVIISTKMLFWYFVKFTLLSLMGTLDRYILQIGYLCFTMYFGRLGHVYSLLYLIE